ncbi:hypothetical protein OH492_12335 [Vibrio chagasii]|nr:hypothetical protein [Vibrio chagasii]
MKSAADVNPVTLELGGKSPVIVTEDMPLILLQAKSFLARAPITAKYALLGLRITSRR